MKQLTGTDRIRRLKNGRKGSRQCGQPQGIRSQGGRSGYTLFSEIEARPAFPLNRHDRQRRSNDIWAAVCGSYRQGNGGARRVADWRARKIIQDCDRLILEKPSHTTCQSAPPADRYAQIRPLIEGHDGPQCAHLLSGEEGMAFEKRILRPSHTQVQYRDQTTPLHPPSIWLPGCWACGARPLT